MKKNIEIDENLFNSLESIRQKYHIKSLTPVISMALTVGVEILKKQSYPGMNNYPQSETSLWPVIEDFSTGTKGIISVTQ